MDERSANGRSRRVAEAAARALDGAASSCPRPLKQRFAAVPMAFVMVPLRDASGQAIAAFAWRILPQRMADDPERGEAGRDGRDLRRGRRRPHGHRVPLRRPGGEAGPAAAGGRRPDDGRPRGARSRGRARPEGAAPKTPPKTWPLTWAVAEAVAGRAGVNADGYRDYRGVPVVGAWQLAARMGHRRRHRDRPRRGVPDAGGGPAGLRRARRPACCSWPRRSRSPRAASTASRGRSSGPSGSGSTRSRTRSARAGWAPSTGRATPSCGGPPRSS